MSWLPQDRHSDSRSTSLSVLIGASGQATNIPLQRATSRAGFTLRVQGGVLTSFLVNIHGPADRPSPPKLMDKRCCLK